GAAHVVQLGSIRVKEVARRGAHKVGDCQAGLSPRRGHVRSEAGNPAASRCAGRDDVEWHGGSPISPKSQASGLYARGAFRAVTFESQLDRICFLLPAFARHGKKTGNTSKLLP